MRAQMENVMLKVTQQDATEAREKKHPEMLSPIAPCLAPDQKQTPAPAQRQQDLATAAQR
jgi:hypothetical protein